MSRFGLVLAALAAMAATPALAAPHYMFCFGGGPAALYYSAVFAVPEGTKSTPTAKAFTAFVQGKYGHSPGTECHSNQTQAIADADKKQREDSNQTSKFPYKIVETGWMGK
jgi:hypothetical protein